MSLADIPVDGLITIAPFRAQGDVRYYLDGIYAEPDPEGGAVLCATNGHMLAITRSPEALVESAFILKWSKTMDAAARRAMRISPNARALIETRTANAKIVAQGEFHIEAGSAIIDGVYPAWRKVVPHDLARGLPGSYNSEYLDQILSIRIPGCVRKYNGVTFFHDAKCQIVEEAVVVARFSGLPDLIVVLMPMRDKDAVNGLPAWLKKPQPAAAERPEEKAA